ncbi:hydrolases or acyltransferase [Xylariales sp. PMI_506]|nr:hydrolases or acyltransferase [Xylariales sp. PMI_506]
MADVPAPQGQPPTISEGYVSFAHPSIPTSLDAKTWYRTIGNLKGDEEGHQKQRPLIALHGGPGAGSASLVPALDVFSQKTGRPVIYYDQFGCGKSTHFPERDGDESFWVQDLFIAELDNLLGRLGIAEDFDLYGQSWGGKLAVLYVIEKQPPGLKNLVISNSTSNGEVRAKVVERLRSKLPEDVQRTLIDNHKRSTDQSPESRAALMVYYENYLYRAPFAEWPQALRDTVKTLAETKIHRAMSGPNVLFEPGGSMKDYNTDESASRIKVPTLVLTAEYDESQFESVEAWLKVIPKVKHVDLRGRSHMAMLEDTYEYVAVLEDFLVKGSVAKEQS